MKCSAARQGSGILAGALICCAAKQKEAAPDPLLRNA
jgi:hypothetical protein